MVKLDYLKPFVFYRTKTPVIMPEGADNRKKGNAFMVLAPTVKDEIEFIANTDTLYFRHLYKYFIEKSTMYKFVGAGQKKFYNNADNEVGDLIEKYKKKKNLMNLDGVTSYLPTYKGNVLKDFNMIVEINHLIEKVINNEKDHRTPALQAPEIITIIKTFVGNFFNKAPYNFGNYGKPWLIIPMDLWFTPDELMSVQTFSKTTKNVMGAIVYRIQSDPTLAKAFKDVNIALVSDHKVMVLNLEPSALPENAKPTILTDSIKLFAKKCKITGGFEKTDTETPNEESEEVSEEDIKLAERKTYTDLAVEKVLEKSKIDPDEVDASKKAELAKMLEPEPVADDGAEPSTDAILDIPKLNSVGDIDIVLQARAAGQTVENYKRNQLMKEKYKSLKLDGVSLEDVMQEEEKYEVPVIETKISTVNDGLKQIKSHEFEASYNKNLAQYDLANILLHFSHVKPALYLNKDIQVEDVSDTMNKLYKYTVEFEDEKRKRHHFSFLLPKMYQDKYLFINEQKWNIVHQKVPYPVTKVGSNLCQIATNYNKIFMSRYGNNISAKVTKLSKLLISAECPSGVKCEKGNTVKLNKQYLTTIEYDELGASLYKLQTLDSTIYFSIDDAYMVMGNKPPKFTEKTPTDEHLYPIGFTKVGKDRMGIKYYLSGETNKIYDDDGKMYGELSDLIIQIITKSVPKFGELFDETSAGTKFVYTRAKVLALDVPLILFLGAADPGGLIAVLEKAQIKHEFTTKRPSDIDKNNQGVITFSDGWLVFDRYPYENSLLLNGLTSFPTKDYSYYDMGTRDTYVEIFDLLFDRRNLIDGIENFYYLLIDPITFDVLRKLDMPTDFTRLVLYAGSLLADNSYKIDSNYEQSRIRSNEIIYAQLYRELATAFAPYKDGRSDKFAIPQDAVIKYLLSANIVDSHSKLNVTLECENDRQIKLKGPGGMNEERSFTLEKRAYHPTMKGIVSMNSTPSGEVGIGRHLSLNANILDARGFIAVGKDSYEGMELLSPGEALQTFGPESADIERLAMAISQSKHLVPTASLTQSPISYDMERAIPYISNDFAYKAKQDGKVIDIKNDIMIVKYSDGTVDDVDLSEHPDKNTDGGFYIMNQLSTDLKIGDSFKANDIIARDVKYIGNNDIFGDYTANVGTLARVALECNGNVYEDACYITDKLAHKLATKITVEKNVIISKYANIKYMVKKGQKVKANDPILTFDDTEDEFTSQLLSSMAEEAEDSDEVIATTAPVITKVTGTIKDIKIYYTVPLEEMTPSLRKVVEASNAENAARSKVISKYKDIKDSTTILTPTEKLTPDSTGRIKGVKVGDGVLIEFFIEYEDIHGVGDKLTEIKRPA